MNKIDNNHNFKEVPCTNFYQFEFSKETTQNFL